ncbi:MAG: ABC transporter permease subunit [Alphaproteobacteria bacterium]|jgi:putrescine transport system permease protein|nr:ABC transporter permease subunit [Alphaproteobacteria bacterium]MBT5389795.1 ABC transporter permease subunit [Alphaproteobacteria bacterium]MBT5540121.1 ABC transporter permease subunit [Alphaproteobacteria bacterium]MBT5655093.1 ABC transporter permease subunit [Alphaproteobacteria bacterium]
MKHAYRPFLRSTVLAFGYAFLYLPIVILIFYSFNESRLVTVWSGFSTKWYTSLLDNHQLLSAVWVSLKVATMTATFSTILGTLAALVLTRLGPFRGRSLFSGLVTAPLVMPEVITGLSLLLLFVSTQQMFGWPHGRGIITITIAHVTFSMAYVAAMVQVRLANFDNTLREAALDLGAPPMKVFFLITLPIISPALVAGWILAFVLSMDDVVIASFVSGPGSTTLPMLIFSSIRMGITPQINALATIIILVAGISVGLSSWIIYRKRKDKA